MSTPRTSPGTPGAEVRIDIELVRHLLIDQHVDLSMLRLQPVGEGWDNAMFRLGDELCVRLPRRKIAAELIVNEHTWLPLIAGRLPIPIPKPLRLGLPGRDYPWRWSIVPWLPGLPGDEAAPDPDQAGAFAVFLRALHQPAPHDAPANWARGVALCQRADSVDERIERLASGSDVITPEILQIWEDALAVDVDVEPRLLHGDLHPRNILVEDGKISGIVDWGDITGGDIATDLAAVWMLFDEPATRREFFMQYGGVSEATRRRTLGWAVFFGTVLLDSGLVDDPRHAAIGEKTLRRLSQSASRE